MIVSFYKMDKRLNSTKLPASAPFVEYTNVILKSPSSVVNPTIAIVEKGVGVASPIGCNYAHIADYGRYYWVRNWTFQDHQWIAALEVDPLATYKTQIGGSTKYVLRSASESDPEVMDTLYPAKTEVVDSISKPFIVSDWSMFGTSENYVMTVIGKGNTAGTNAIVAQYLLSAGSVQTVIDNMLDAVEAQFNGAQANDIGDSIKNLLLLPSRFTTDLSQYVVSLMWFPWSYPTGGSLRNIYLGMYPVLANSQPITSPLKISRLDIDISDIVPASADKWEYMAPFAQYWIEWEPFGMIPIDSVDVVNSIKLELEYQVDSISGLGLLRVYAYETAALRRLVATRTAQVGVAIPFGGSAPNYAGAISGAIGVASTAAAWIDGNASGGELAATIGSAAAASSPTGFASGTSGGCVGVKNVGSFYGRILRHTDTDPTEHGKPLCKNRVINTLSGFVKCADGHISASGATQAELSAVESYLTGGFFYE